MSKMVNFAHQLVQLLVFIVTVVVGTFALAIALLVVIVSR